MEGAKALATKEMQKENKHLNKEAKERNAVEKVQLLIELRALHQQAVNKATTRRT
jgi:hypothetical protein